LKISRSERNAASPHRRDRCEKYKKLNNEHKAQVSDTTEAK
jgi:hypothetical protein